MYQDLLCVKGGIGLHFLSTNITFHTLIHIFPLTVTAVDVVVAFVNPAQLTKKENKTITV